MTSEPKNEAKKIGEWPFAILIGSETEEKTHVHKHVDRLHIVIDLSDLCIQRTIDR